MFCANSDRNQKGSKNSARNISISQNNQLNAILRKKRQCILNTKLRANTLRKNDDSINRMSGQSPEPHRLWKL